MRLSLMSAAAMALLLVLAFSVASPRPTTAEEATPLVGTGASTNSKRNPHQVLPIPQR